MSDPRRPDGYDPNRPYWSRPTEQIPAVDPPYSYPSYGGWTPPAPDATRELPPYWTQTQPPPPGPPAPEHPPEPPPRTPRWLWLLAGAAVTLVIGLVIALVIANGANRDDAAPPPVPTPTTTLPAPTTTRTTPTTTAPTTTQTTAPTTTSPTTTSPTTTTTDAAGTATVVYNVTGTGRALTITYVGTDGVMQIEFNVPLPWSREVTMSSSTARNASVSVVNVSDEINCSITVDGNQVRQLTGTGITLCMAGAG